MQGQTVAPGGPLQLPPPNIATVCTQCKYFGILATMCQVGTSGPKLFVLLSILRVVVVQGQIGNYCTNGLFTGRLGRGGWKGKFGAFLGSLSVCAVRAQFKDPPIDVHPILYLGEPYEFGWT